MIRVQTVNGTVQGSLEDADTKQIVVDGKVVDRTAIVGQPEFYDN